MGMFRFYDFIFPLLIFVSDVSIVLGKVAHRLCNLVHCCRAAIGAMASEPYCRSMLDRPSDEDVSRQILGVFMRHRIPATGTLQRNYFFEVRDGDFQRGINKAVANNWITIDLRNRSGQGERGLSARCRHGEAFHKKNYSAHKRTKHEMSLPGHSKAVEILPEGTREIFLNRVGAQLRRRGIYRMTEQDVRDAVASSLSGLFFPNGATS